MSDIKKENIISNLKNRYIDILGNVIIKKENIIELFYEKDNLINSSNIFFENCSEVEKYNQEVDKNINNKSLRLKTEKDINYEKNLQELIDKKSKKWFIPEIYQKIDIENWFYSKNLNEKERKRISDELKLFKKYDLYDLLKLLIYISDVIKEKKLVTGVGRGSSVSCFCLYVIGIHRINPIEYDLDYNEFFKENIEN